ncbi:MAG: Ada metal-binding domain-containing protein [Oscillospiraceae bacterium]|nr:Ada metal-binding domain-containing protein [Oscillospiraceae bacterium]
MTEEEMYEAVISNDGNYDGLFFYAVKSTGIFCRPSCQSKKPLKENVRFFQSADEAMRAGFRPCKRCRSDLLSYRPMEEIAKMVKGHLDALYERQAAWYGELHEMGFSVRRVVEIFKDVYGMTPKAYMDTLKLKEAKRMLTETEDKVIDIAASVGFGGLSTFNRFFKEQEGCSPVQYRKANKQ